MPIVLSTQSQIELVDLDRRDAGEAARLLADAFLDDPAWSAGSPRRRGHRGIANRISFRALLHASRRSCGTVRGVRSGQSLHGVAVSFDPGLWPIPDHAGLLDLLWLFIAGPAPARRAYRDDETMRGVHMLDPHLYLWVVGVEPAAQGRGLGRALIEDAINRAQAHSVPVYLETATQQNLEMYLQLGFQLLGEVALPSGVRMRRLEHPAR